MIKDQRKLKDKLVSIHILRRRMMSECQFNQNILLSIVIYLEYDANECRERTCISTPNKKHGEKSKSADIRL